MPEPENVAAAASSRRGGGRRDEATGGQQPKVMIDLGSLRPRLVPVVIATVAGGLVSCLLYHWTDAQEFVITHDFLARMGSALMCLAGGIFGGIGASLPVKRMGGRVGIGLGLAATILLAVCFHSMYQEGYMLVSGLIGIGVRWVYDRCFPLSE